MSASVATFKNVPLVEAYKTDVKLPKILDQLEAPENDDRLFRLFWLNNGLEILAVHDSKAKDAGVAIDVNVGNFSDPEPLPGTSYAVAHLLWMGTEAHPKENDMVKFLSENDGDRGAMVYSTHVNYWLRIAPRALYEGLERFAKFFIHPLFNDDTLIGVLKVIDSYHRNNCYDEGLRIEQVMRSTSNPNHPYSRFKFGTFDLLKTEPEAVRNELMKFFDNEYSANRMKVVVTGPQPVEVLEGWITGLFKQIPNKNLQQNLWKTEVPLRPEDLQTLCFAKAKKAWDWIDFDLQFPDETSSPEKQSSRYICALLNHTGGGSIFNKLRSKSWASADPPHASVDPVCPDSNGILTYRIFLTREGVTNYREVAMVFSQYLGLLERTPPQERIFNEMKKQAELNFKHQHRMHAHEFAQKTSANMQKPFPRKHLLNHCRLTNFDLAAIEKGLKCLKPENFRIRVVSRAYPGCWSQREKCFDTEYTCDSIPADFLAEMKRAHKIQSPELHLPRENPFSPANLKAKEEKSTKLTLEPNLIYSNDTVRTWHKNDIRVPKAELYVHCMHSMFTEVKNFSRARLYGEMMEDALREEADEASLFNVVYSLTCHRTGIRIHVSGYDDLAPTLLEKVLITMRDLVAEPVRFNVAKDKVLKQARNVAVTYPWHQAWFDATWLCEMGHFAEQDLEELSRLTLADLEDFRTDLLKGMNLEILVYGNIYKKTARELSGHIEGILKPRPLPQSQWPLSRSVSFPPGSNFRYAKTIQEPENDENAIQYILHVGDKSDVHLRAMTLLFSQICEEPAFDQLRTKERLGFVVLSRPFETATAIGFQITVQSNKSPRHIEQRIDAFLFGICIVIANMSDLALETEKSSVINSELKETPNSEEEAKRLWSHIKGGYFNFELGNYNAIEIGKLGRSDMTSFCERYINPASTARSKLVVQALAGTFPIVKEVAEINGSTPFIITNIKEFNSKMQLGDRPRPVKDFSEFEDLETGAESRH